MPSKNKLVNRKAFSSALRNDLYEELDLLHKDTKIPKSQLFDEAIELLLVHRGRTDQPKNK